MTELRNTWALREVYFDEHGNPSMHRDPVPMTDEQIESEFQQCGGKWNGDQWVIEDADLHHFCRAILALRPAAVPMSDEYVQAACGDIFASDHTEPGAYDLAIWRKAETAHGITAQAKKEDK